MLHLTCRLPLSSGSRSEAREGCRLGIPQNFLSFLGSEPSKAADLIRLAYGLPGFGRLSDAMTVEVPAQNRLFGTAGVISRR